MNSITIIGRAGSQCRIIVQDDGREEVTENITRFIYDYERGSLSIIEKSGVDFEADAGFRLSVMYPPPDGVYIPALDEVVRTLVVTKDTFFFTKTTGGIFVAATGRFKKINWLTFAEGCVNMLVEGLDNAD